MAIQPDRHPRRWTRPADVWREAGIEPSLCEVLNDPLVHQVMRRDGVTFDELAGVIALAQVKLQRGLCRLAA